MRNFVIHIQVNVNFSVLGWCYSPQSSQYWMNDLFVHLWLCSWYLSITSITWQSTKFYRKLTDVINFTTEVQWEKYFTYYMEEYNFVSTNKYYSERCSFYLASQSWIHVISIARPTLYQLTVPLKKEKIKCYISAKTNSWFIITCQDLL